MRSAKLGALTGLVAGATFVLVSLIQQSGIIAASHPSFLSAAYTWLYSLCMYGVLGCAAGWLVGLLVGLPASLTGREPRPSTLLALLAGLAALAVFFIQYGAYRYFAISVYIPRNDPVRSRAMLEALGVAVVVGLLIAVLVRFFAGRFDRDGAVDRLGPRLIATVVLALVASLGVNAVRGLGGAPSGDPSVDGGRTRVFLFGIDAASWEMMMPLVQAGRMPNLAGLMERGAWGDTVPYYSLVHHSDWTTMVTGVSPEKHDVWLSFMKEEGRYFFVPSGPQHRKAPALWTLLGEKGRPSAVVNWLVTAPPEEMNGVMVAEMALPGEPRTYPPELAEALDPLVEVKQERSGPPRVELFADTIDDVVAHSFVNLDSMEIQFRHVLEQQSWDLFVSGIFTTDHVQHLFFKFARPDDYTGDKWNLNPEVIAKYGDVLNQIFERVDEVLGSVLEYADDDTVVVVASDHGMEPTRDLFVNLKLNAVLEKLGVLEFYDPVERPDKLQELNDFLAVTGRPPLSADLGKDGIVYRVPNQFLFMWTDFDRSRAYSSGTRTYEDIHGVSVNLIGRDENGIVEEADYEALRQELVEELRKIEVIETGVPLFNSVHLRENEPDDTMRASGYDVTLQFGSPTRKLDPNRHVEIAGERYRLNDLLEDEENSADHSLYSMFAMAGGPIRQRTFLRTAPITPVTFVIEKWSGRVGALRPVGRLARALGLIPRVNQADVAPTILHLLGEPVPPGWDGRVLDELIDPDFVPTSAP